MMLGEVTIVLAVRAVSDLTVHDHLCFVYDRPAEARQSLLDYVVAGLARCERVHVYREPGAPGATIEGDLRAAGLPVSDLMASGMLLVGSARETCLAGDDGDAARLVDVVATATRAALNEGLNGLRVYVETGFLLDQPDALAAWPGCELRVDLLAKQLPITAVCAYDVREWTPGNLALAEMVHTRRSRHHGALRMHAGRDGTLRLSGEVDWSAADQVYRLLVKTAWSRPTPVLDVSGVSFVDVSGARSIGTACEAIAGRHGPTRLRAAPPLLREIWDSATWSASFPSVRLED
jgi:anti-anti-sigma regulatory factor